MAFVVPPDGSNGQSTAEPGPVEAVRQFQRRFQVRLPAHAVTITNLGIWGLVTLGHACSPSLTPPPSLQSILDRSTPFVLYRWLVWGFLLLLYTIRVYTLEGWAWRGWHGCEALGSGGSVQGTGPLPPSVGERAVIRRLGPTTSPHPSSPLPWRRFYIVTYALGIYNLNLLLGFLTPQVDPELEGPTLPSKSDEEFRPFVRKLPEFKAWCAVVGGVE